MIWLLIAILTVVLVELFLRLSLVDVAKGVAQTGRRAVRTLGKRNASDHWKEKASRIYAVQMLGASFSLAWRLGLIIVVAAILIIALEPIVPGIGAGFIRWQGIIISIAAATAYVMLRSRFVRQ